MSLNIAYESDRGCIIVAAASFDKLLEDIIKRHINKFSVSRSLEKNLFDLSGPISNFSAEISVCRAFGLIDDLAYNDLMILRKLRNAFAHAAEEASFLSSEVKQKVRGMHFVQHCMQETEIARYACEEKEGDEKTVPATCLKEWEALSRGYLSYDKSMFCLAIAELEHHIDYYSISGKAPGETLSQMVKSSRAKKS